MDSTLNDALREQIGTPDGVPTVGGPVGALRPADRLVLDIHRQGLTGVEDARERAWLDQLLAGQPEWTEATWTGAVRQVAGAGLTNGQGLTGLGRVQVQSLMGRFRV